jgi:subtilisin family serine protease
MERSIIYHFRSSCPWCSQFLMKNQLITIDKFNMSKITRKRSVLVGVLMVLALGWGGVTMAQTGNLAKIDPELQEKIHNSRDANETFRVIIEMTEQYNNPNLERGTALMTRAQRRDYVVNELKLFSESTQADIVTFLNEQGTRGQVNVLHRFWIFNGLCCEATADCIGELSMRHDVRFVALPVEMNITDPIEESNYRGTPPQTGVQWHVSKVRANEVWNYPNTTGFTGTGVVVAIIDSGLNYNHVDISSNLWDGGELYPHHGWDFYNNDNNPIDTTTSIGHGTHVAGIVAGHGLTYQSGVAPGATIMVLKVFGDYHNSPTHLESPSEDMLCQAIEFAIENGADVLNLSVGRDGSGGVAIMRDSFVNVLNAGVVATVSAGNVGNKLNTYPVPNNVGSPGNCPPPWHNPDQDPIGGASAVICVGATKQNDTLAHYSSRGPATWTQGAYIGHDYLDYPYLLHPPVLGGLIRPDVVAPGGEGMNESGSVWSLQHNSNTEYVGYPGTSMAAPCVAGVIALMLEANPNLTPVKIDSILETTAIPCENLDIKNNFYGAGRVDAYAAVTAALNLNSPQRYHISVAKFPFEDRFEVTGTGHYLADSSCTITASPANRFDRWEKDGDIISTDAIHTIDAVTEDAEYIGFFYEGEIITTAFPTAGGTIEGDGMYHAGDQCTVTATPNPGFAFLGWYSGAFLVSIHPEYTFTVTGDRHLYAHFILANYTVMTSCSPTAGGSVAGGGTYMAGSTVTLTATANSGYVFSCWTENGQVVSNQPTYSFRAMSDRHLVANFMNLSFSLGTVITNPDGSKGVVFYINPTYTGGCMVALEDVSTGCTWGSSGDIPFVRNYTYTQNECLLSDLNGYANTEVLRNYQSVNPNYASGKVDFGQGWYVPSAGQLRKLYGALPFIEVPMVNAGGTTLSDNVYYWSSTENSETSAWTSSFEMKSNSKTSNYRIRAVHDFSINNTARVQLRTNNAELGTVAGTGFYANGATVTVTATPSGNNLFRGWTEKGHLVSQDPSYTFPANANRDLVANFAIRGGVGTLVNNPDGSQGVLFYLNDDGTEGWMVALEDASESCQWGSNNDVAIMKDLSWNDQKVLRDQNGFYNTWLIRISQGTDNGYAASIVDFDNGWYLPSAGQLRKLYAELPMIEEAIIKAGGSTLTDGKYWSSTEYSASYASTPGFEVSYTSKTTNCRVRAIRNYVPDGDHVVLVAANEDYMGTASVSGSGVFAQNQTVTVTATPNVGYQFDHWTEDGVTVSYDAEYQFPFTRSRSLVAHFVVPGSIGSIVTNADGSRGVVFYTDPSGTGSLIVALEDVSEGCAWGANQDVTPLENLNPNQVQNLLEDQNGYSHTQIIRDWQESNTNYAAGKVDYANDWYLPSAGQLRKLYAVLPLIEEAIVCAGGTLISNNAYWSSSENSSSYAWSPSFEFTKTNKTSNLRVRAIREINMPVNPGIIAQTTPLSQGWNWFSTYIEVEDPLAMLETVEAALGANGQVIKNSEMGTEYDSEWGWFGDLDDVGMTNEQMYKIQVSAPCTLSLEGVPANPAVHPIIVNPGWNWIGFPSGTQICLDDAFAGFAQEGDKIRNSAAEIVYDPEWGWFGDFETLVPGQGYMYYSASSVPRTLVFPTGAK